MKPRLPFLFLKSPFLLKQRYIQKKENHVLADGDEQECGDHGLPPDGLSYV